MSDDGVELTEGGEAEEGVDDVGRQVDRRLPLLSEIEFRQSILEQTVGAP